MKHGESKFGLRTSTYILNRYPNDRKAKERIIREEAKLFREHCERELLAVGIKNN